MTIFVQESPSNGITIGAATSMVSPGSRPQVAGAFSFSPGKLAPEELCQPSVRLCELVLELRARRRAHPGVFALEDPGIRIEPVRIDAEDLQHAPVRRAGLGGELVGQQDEQLLGSERPEPALELLRIAAARDVRVVPPRITEVRGVAEHALDLADHPLVLAREGILERQLLASERDLVLVVGERTVDGIAQ